MSERCHGAGEIEVGTVQDSFGTWDTETYECPGCPDCALPPCDGSGEVYGYGCPGCVECRATPGPALGDARTRSSEPGGKAAHKPDRSFGEGERQMGETHELTEDEQRVVRALDRLAKTWPRHLTLASMGGALCLFRTAEMHPGEQIGIEPEAQLWGTTTIPNTGGDW